MTWEQGRAEVAEALRTRRLQQVTGGQAVGEGWLEVARRRLATARLYGADDPESAYILSYDAARHALVGVLAHQGLRGTTEGGHLIVEQITRAQFGAAFAEFSVLRRRRSELEYPAFPGEKIEIEELDSAVASAGRIIDGAEQLLSHLTLFHD